jgi:hypothetical protein
MRVAAAFGASRRGESKHALDSERHLRHGFSDNNFTVRPRVSRQIDETRVSEFVHDSMHHRWLHRT